MNKSILLSIKPKYVAKILNGEKTIEVRKNKALYKATKKLIEEQGYATFFMYCSKGKDLCYKTLRGDYDVDNWKVLENRDNDKDILNGKVVAKFTVRKVEEIECAIDYDHECGRDCTYHTDSMCQEVLGECSCLYNDIDEYLDWKPDNIVGYAYHIEDLVIFDKPKELSDFYKWCEPFEINKGCGKVRWEKSLTKAPQNFMYIESEE